MWVDEAKKERLLKLLIYGHAEAANDFLVHVAREVGAPQSHLAKEAHRGVGLLDVSIGTFREFKTDVRLVAMPDNPVSRLLIVKHSDGALLIADPSRIESSHQLFLEMQQNVTKCGYSIDSFPCAVLIDVRGADRRPDDARLRNLLCVPAHLCFEGDSVKGVGIFDPLKAVVKHVVSSLPKDASAKGAV